MTGFFDRRGYTTEREQRIDFTVGFTAWYVLNSVIWVSIYLLSDSYLLPDPLSTVLSCIEIILLFAGYPINAALVIVMLVRKRKWFALGFVAALAMNFIIAAILGVFWKTICFVPFFVPPTLSLY